MKQSSSWDANRSSANQEIPRILWNEEVRYYSHKGPPTSGARSMWSMHPLSHFLNIHLILSSSHLPVCLPIYLFPSDSAQKSCTPCSCPSYILHAPPISFFLVWTPEQYPVTSTNHEARRHNSSSFCPVLPQNISKPSTLFLLRSFEHPILSAKSQALKLLHMLILTSSKQHAKIQYSGFVYLFLFLSKVTHLCTQFRCNTR